MNTLSLALGPLKVEELHGEPHQILVLHNFASDRESNQLVKLAAPKMEAAPIGAGKSISEIRVSRNTWLEDNVSGVVDAISLRINEATGYQTARKYDECDEGREQEYEGLQVAHYSTGGHYYLHQDPIFLYTDPEHPVRLDDANFITGDRMATLMIYLSDVAGGGRTAFPRLGVAAEPSKGAAVFWRNLLPTLKSDMHLLHGGCPVLLGSKWVANKWVRSAPNIFRRQCPTNGPEWDTQRWP